MESKVAMFGIYDHVTNQVESIGCFSGSTQAARALVAMYAFSSNPAVCNRLIDYDFVQLSEFFDPMNTNDKIKHIYISYCSLAKLKSVFDKRDGIFTIA